MTTPRQRWPRSTPRSDALRSHRIQEQHFDALAAGQGDEQALAVLVDGQLSRRKLLLSGIDREVREQADAGPAQEHFLAAWDALTGIEARAPTVVSGPDGVLRNPYLGVWARQCLRDLTSSGRGAGGEAVSRRLSYFTGVVAVAAVRAGFEIELDVLIPGQGLALPGLGRIEPFPDPGPVTLRAGAGGVTAGTPSGPEHELRDPVRILARTEHPIRLEDTDPFRDAFGHPVGPRLDDVEATRWRATFEAGWQLITDHHRPYLPGLATGLSSITPLLGPASGADTSAASRHAFGAVALGLPPSPARLAVLLVHEFQHVKLGALLDLVTLTDDSHRGVFHVPWRPDPRPLAAVLQGSYAHLGVTDFWRRQRHRAASADEARLATQQFARWRAGTAAAIDVMLASSALTEAGRRFISGMAAAVAPWLGERVGS